MRFEGTDNYIATEDLMMAVNAAITLERPLLIKGEPGTGKTQLAQEVSLALRKPLHEWHVKSTSKAQQGLYEYDAVSRLRDSQLGDPRVHDIRNYIVKGKLWEAFDSEVQPVLLIDAHVVIPGGRGKLSRQRRGNPCPRSKRRLTSLPFVAKARARNGICRF